MILRWDTKKLYAALNNKRQVESKSWQVHVFMVSQEEGSAAVVYVHVTVLQYVARLLGCGFTTSMLTRLSKGGRVTFPSVMMPVLWLGMPASDFMTTNPHPTEIR